jgi:hypothetical protein
MSTMQAATALLDRMTGTSTPHGPILVSLVELFTGFARSFWAPGIPVAPEPTSPSSLLVVASDQVSAYSFTGSEGWIDHDAILAAFAARNRTRKGGGRGGSKTGPLPKELLTGEGLRLVLRDRDDPLACLATHQAVYPRRAWVGAFHPGLDPGMPFIVAGMLNSTVGHVLYRRLARNGGGSGGHDLRKSVLTRLKIPFMSYDAEAFHRAALLAYRLHCLCAASQEMELPATVHDEEIPNHRMHLLSELVRLYGFTDQDARALVEEVLPAGAADVPGAQGKLFYRPRAPLQQVRFHTPEMLDKYEYLKEQARCVSLDAEGRQRLEHLRTILEWEHRANSPIPGRLPAKEYRGADTAEAAMRLADRYLSARWGQSILSESARQITSQVWEVELIPAAPLRATTAPLSPRDRETRRLWVNALTGAVSEDPGKARDAATSGA